MSLCFNCSNCNNKACLRGGEYPDGCPSVTEKHTIALAVDHVCNDEYDKSILAASEAASHNDKGELNNRVEELVQFCSSMSFEKIGVAFCVALAKEARVLCDILSNEGFDVVPVCCKIGGNEISDMGIESTQPKGIACNPVAQAFVLNANKTDLNVAVGLCLGHDILFSKYSDTPVTTLIVKDRILKHNTLQALQRTVAASV